MRSIITFQDFDAASDSKKKDMILRLVNLHESSDLVKTAKVADEYDAQRNVTINRYVQTIMSLSGEPLLDFTASNAKIASNFFNRLNTQRCMYSLGAGVSFVGPNGTDDAVKDAMGRSFDEIIQDAAYYALIHGISFVFWNLDHVVCFPVTEFAPIWDEFDGTLRAGVRYWRLAYDMPMTLVLYEEDGYTTYRSDTGSKIVEVEPKKAYVREIAYTDADDYATVVGERNYGSLPIVPMYGSRLKQSTIVGMREAIDSFDLIRSGFANDLTDVSQIYWIVENCGGMTDLDLQRFRDRLKITHIANADTSDGGKVVPYQQDVPYQARMAYLDHIRQGIYEDFGALDVHTVEAGATNDHIDAAYQPLDENAADFERQVTECIMQIMRLNGTEGKPVYTRTRISNHKEQVEVVSMEAQWLDEETILRKLPNITPQEASEIIQRNEADGITRLTGGAE